MNEPERIRAKLERMAYFAFTEIQSLARVDGSSPRIAELAETAELIPEYLSRGQAVDLEMLIGGFQEYSEKYGGHAGRYSRIWNMSADEFDAVYGPTTSEWPEPAVAVH